MTAKEWAIAQIREHFPMSTVPTYLGLHSIAQTHHWMSMGPQNTSYGAGTIQAILQAALIRECPGDMSPEAIVTAYTQRTDAERLALFVALREVFCERCGRDDWRCDCSNDE